MKKEKGLLKTVTIESYGNRHRINQLIITGIWYYCDNEEYTLSPEDMKVIMTPENVKKMYESEIDSDRYCLPQKLHTTSNDDTATFLVPLTWLTDANIKEMELTEVEMDSLYDYLSNSRCRLFD